MSQTELLIWVVCVINLQLHKTGLEGNTLEVYLQFGDSETDLRALHGVWNKSRHWMNALILSSFTENPRKRHLRKPVTPTLRYPLHILLLFLSNTEMASLSTIPLGFCLGSHLFFLPLVSPVWVQQLLRCQSQPLCSRLRASIWNSHSLQPTAHHISN